MANSKAMGGWELRKVLLPGTDREIPVVGQGSWGLGADRRRRKAEVAALRLGIELGMTLIDTAEFYSRGEAERVVGEAVRGQREKAFLVTKVWPNHASRDALLRSVSDSLKRLGTDYVDAVLLHWPTRRVPLAETLGALAELQKDGLIRHFGVANFDGAWLDRAQDARDGGGIVFDQVPYSLDDRGIEAEVLPRARERSFLIQAYSPLGHGRVKEWMNHPVLKAVAEELGWTSAQVALAFLLADPHVTVIPKAVHEVHVRMNAAVGDMALPEMAQKKLDDVFLPKGVFHPGIPEAAYGIAWRLGRIRSL